MVSMDKALADAIRRTCMRIRNMARDQTHHHMAVALEILVDELEHGVRDSAAQPTTESDAALLGGRRMFEVRYRVERAQTIQDAA